MAYTSIALNWILFLALFPIAFFWSRRVWKVLVRRDFSEVALKGGMPAPQAEKYAPYDVAIHLIAASVVVVTIVWVVFFQLDYETWNAVAGSTIFCKLFASFALSRQAHGWGKKKEA